MDGDGDVGMSNGDGGGGAKRPADSEEDESDAGEVKNLIQRIYERYAAPTEPQRERDLY